MARRHPRDIIAQLQKGTVADMVKGTFTPHLGLILVDAEDLKQALFSAQSEVAKEMTQHFFDQVAPLLQAQVEAAAKAKTWLTHMEMFIRVDRAYTLELAQKAAAKDAAKAARAAARKTGKKA